MPDSLVAVMGSVTRAYTLAILAGSRVPRTAYRIARLADLSPPNVYMELRRLASAAVVEKVEGGWVLVDDRVRAFCEGRGPLFERSLSLEQKRGWRRENRFRISQMLKQPVPQIQAKRGPEPKILREVGRSLTKNKALRAAGLTESRHRGR